MSELEVNFSKYGENISEYYSYKRNERQSNSHSKDRRNGSSDSKSKERRNESSDSKSKERDSSAEKNKALHLNLKKIPGFEAKEKKEEEDKKSVSTSFTKDRLLGRI